MNTVARVHESLYCERATEYKVEQGTTVNEWLNESGYKALMLENPIVVSLNGRELLECDYDTVIKQGDRLELQQYPRGAAFVKFIYWVYVVFTVVSAIYILTMPEPGLPETADIKEGSPTYSVSARGNRYRPESKGPILYGTLRVVPDFDQWPFSTYDANNDQTLHMLFRITQGVADIDLASITFEDTPLSNFQNVEIEVIPPGAAPTLFPLGVIESNDISNVELLDSVTVAYVASDVGTELSKIAVDITSPNLAVQDRATGELSVKTVQFRVEAQKIDDASAPVGSWFTLGFGSLSGSSRDAIRRTFEYPVEIGRYQVRIKRLTAKDTSQYVQDSIYWAGLKGYLYDPDNISSNTRLAISIRASEQIGNRALTDMSVVCSRRLPFWDPSVGWTDLELTNSIAWAMADLCRANYAGNRSDLNYDLQKLYELHNQLTPLGHEFNAYFDTEGVSVWDALIKAGTPGRITPIDKAGFYTFVRDEIQPSAVQSFTMRNIIRGSFRIDHNGVLEETADAVIVEFQDEDNDYRIRKLPCALPDSASLNPRTIKLFGVTNATRAKELGMFMAACNRYRRKITVFETGIEGRIPFYGSRIAISHFLIGAEGVKQISGDIVGFDGMDVLQLSERINADHFSDPHIVIVDLDGKPMPAYPVTIVNDFSVRVAGDVDWDQIQIEPNYKRPMFVLGDGENYITYSKVTKIERDGAAVKIEAFVDDPRPYIYGEDVIPPDHIDIPAPQTAAPMLSELQAHVGGTVERPVVTLTWSLKNSDKTDIQFSVDGGVTYTPIGVGYVYQNQYVHRPDPGSITYRLAAVNLFRGPWVTVTVDTSSAAFNPPQAPTGLMLRESFTGPVLKIKWSSGSYRHFIEVVVGAVVLYTESVEGLTWDFSGVLAQQYGVGRAFTVRVYAVGENSKTSLGYAQLAVSNPAPPQLNNLAVIPFLGVASVTFTWPVVADLAGISVWKSEIDGFTPGQSELVVDRSMNPVLAVPVDEDEVAYIRVAAVDVWGTNGLNISGQFTITGKGVDLGPVFDDLEALQEVLAEVETDLAAAKVDLAELDDKFPITETDISDGAISTPKLSANSITADKIVANAITAEKIVALTITGDKIAANAISADKIVANTITGDKIAALTITAGQIAANAITASKLSVSELSAITAAMGTLTAGLLKTTSSGTDARLEIDSNGSFPLWVGANGKDASNGQFFYDKTNQMLVIREPATGRRFEFQPSSSMPFWYGYGTKSASNAWMYFDAATQRLVLRNIQAESGFVTTLQSNNYSPGVSGYRLNSDGSAEFNNIVFSRPNVIANGTFNVTQTHQRKYEFNIYTADGYVGDWRIPNPDTGGATYMPYDGKVEVLIDTGYNNNDEINAVNSGAFTGRAVVTAASATWSSNPGAAKFYDLAVSCEVKFAVDHYSSGASTGVPGGRIYLRCIIDPPRNVDSRIRSVTIDQIQWALIKTT
jgi:hypothetical protein